METLTLRGLYSKFMGKYRIKLRNSNFFRCGERIRGDGASTDATFGRARPSQLRDECSPSGEKIVTCSFSRRHKVTRVFLRFRSSKTSPTFTARAPRLRRGVRRRLVNVCREPRSRLAMRDARPSSTMRTRYTTTTRTDGEFVFRLG